ncbi:MAG: basic amino acid ABC transporter substrate-binding protein [Coriobacteriia bacterium]
MLKVRQMRGLVCALALALALTALAGCTKSSGGASDKGDAADYKLVEDGYLTVGSDLDFPPMEQLNGDEPEGFDVDLMTAIAREMGLKIKYLPPQKFDALTALVNAGKFDVIASSMTINDDRKKVIVFSDPYFESNQSIAMKEGSTYTSPSDLAGKKIGAQSGTTGEQWATENLVPAGATVVPFKNTSEAFAALQGGTVDAVVNDLPITNEFVKDPAKGLTIVKQIPTGELYGFGVAMENPELATAINEALAKIIDSGEYKTMYEKWIGPLESDPSQM